MRVASRNGSTTGAFRTAALRRGFCLVLLLFACRRAPTAAAHAPRFVSLAPNLTEMIYALGDGDLLAGTDVASDFPAAAKALPKVGNGLTPNIERIVALRPTLVIAIAAGLHPNLPRALDAQHIPLLVVRTDRLADVPRAMQRIRDAAGRERAPAIATILHALGRQRRVRAKPPRILFVVWSDPLYIAGRDTFTSDLFDVCGARNAASVSGWPQYSLESLIASPPDLLLYPNRSVSAAQIEALKARAKLTCPIVAVDENVFVRPGPRMAEAAAALNGIVDRWEKGVTPSVSEGPGRGVAR
jgi:vitamin B12 transport system substrate-binding protein